jgi:peptidoglycan hydrolase CwlO-like protein
MKKLFLVLFLLLSTIYYLRSTTTPVHAVCGDPLPNPPDKNFDYTGYISDCQLKSSAMQGQEKTLAATLDALSKQISFTQAKIAATQEQLSLLNTEITDLSGRISSIDYSLTDLTKLFVSRVRETYMYRGSQDVIFVAQASGLPDLIRNIEYAKRVRDYDRTILISLEKSRLDYNAQKDIKEAKQKEVASLQQKLTSDKAALADQVTTKNKLLADTKNNEARFNQLLAQASAQLASLASFAESVGITLLPHQDLSDSWGKYYNQRDSQWGNVVMNGSMDCGGACTIAKVGCLISSYAMVSSHYGGSVLPSDVATNSSNFYSVTALFNSPGPSANGHTSSDYNNPSTGQLKDALNSGKAVIAGMSMNGGPAPQHYADHWVVLRSVDGDSFRINDPEYPGAMNVSIKDHYASWTIIQAKIYN